MKKRPIVLCIMDGYGLTDCIDGNAVSSLALLIAFKNFSF